MLVGYMRVSTDNDRQSTDLQRDALLATGVDARNLFQDHASGARDDRPGLAKALEYLQSGDVQGDDPGHADPQAVHLHHHKSDAARDLRVRQAFA